MRKEELVALVAKVTPDPTLSRFHSYKTKHVFLGLSDIVSILSQLQESDIAMLSLCVKDEKDNILVEIKKGYNYSKEMQKGIGLK